MVKYNKNFEILLAKLMNIEMKIHACVYMKKYV